MVLVVELKLVVDTSRWVDFSDIDKVLVVLQTPPIIGGCKMNVGWCTGTGFKSAHIVVDNFSAGGLAPDLSDLSRHVVIEGGGSQRWG